MRLIKSLIHKESVFEAFYPTFLVYKAFGLACFQLKSERFQTSLWDYIGFIGSFVYTLYLLLTINFDSLRSLDFSKVLALGMSMNYLLAYFCMNIYLIANFLTRKRHFNLLRKLHSLDIQMQHLVGINHTKHFIVLAICAVPVIAYIALDLYQGHQVDPWDLLLIDGIGCLNALQFLIAASFLLVRFANFSCYLRKIELSDLRTALTLFQQLLSAIRDVNATFGFQAMIFVFFLITSGIVAIFTSVESFFVSFERMKEIAMVSIYITAYHHVVLVALCIVNGLIEVEIEKCKKFFKLSVHRASEIDILIPKFNIPKLSCGLFSFDWTLLSSVIFTETIYLVTLLQFQNMIR